MSQQNVEMVRAVMEAYQHPEMLASLVNGEFDLELADSQIESDASRLEEMITDLAEIHLGQDGCACTGDGGLRRGRSSSSRSKMCSTQATMSSC